MEDLREIACNPVIFVVGDSGYNPTRCLVYRPDEFRVLVKFIEKTNLVIYGRIGQ